MALCDMCSGVDPSYLCHLVWCTDCQAAGTHERVVVSDRESRERRHALIRTLQHLQQQESRSSTKESNRRGMEDYSRFCALQRVEAFPPTEATVQQYVVWCLTARQPTLDSTTVITYLHGVSAWVDGARVPAQAAGIGVRNPIKTGSMRRLKAVILKYYKLDSHAKLPYSVDTWCDIVRSGFDLSGRYGKQQRLFFMLSTAGPFRPNAMSQLRCIYNLTADGGVEFGPTSPLQVIRGDPNWEAPYIHITVREDKNVDAKHGPREVHIPAQFMGFPILDWIIEYLRNERPPSGGYLLCAPHGRAGWRATPYTNHGEAFKKALLHARPLADPDSYGAGSPRKSLAQWLWTAGHGDRIIADIGGWRLPAEPAVAGYHKTEYKTILEIKSSLYARSEQINARIAQAALASRLS